MQVKPQWTHIEEYDVIAEKLCNKYADRFYHINPKLIIAYGQDKERDPKKSRMYQMSGQTEPESFTNEKKYFVKFHMDDWNSFDESTKICMVFSTLLRIDPEKPESGKLLLNNYKDQSIMVLTFGPYWNNNGKLPNILKEEISFREADENEEIEDSE